MSKPGTLQWTGAGVLAFGLHLGVLMAVFALPKDGAQAPGLGGISVAVTMIAARTGSDSDAREQQAQTPPEASEIVPPEEPVVVEPAVGPPSDEPAPIQPAPVQPPEPEPPVATIPEPSPVIEPLPAVAADFAAPQSSVAEQRRAEAAQPAIIQPPPQALPKPPVRPVREKKTPAPKFTLTRTPKPASTPPKPEPETAAGPVQQASRAATASQGRKDDGRKGQSADEDDAVGGGPVGTPAPNYVNQLRYWLERNKTYPKKARRNRMQGIVHLYFRVTRDGRVLRHEIRKSSGHALLDDETEAMLARAQPLPEFPSSMQGGYLDVVVPVQFSLRGNN